MKYFTYQGIGFCKDRYFLHGTDYNEYIIDGREIPEEMLKYYISRQLDKMFIMEQCFNKILDNLGGIYVTAYFRGSFLNFQYIMEPLKKNNPINILSLINNQFNFKEVDPLVIDHLNIKEEYQNKGYGSKIMNIYIDISNKFKKPLLLFCDPELKTYYNKFGFRKIEIDRKFFQGKTQIGLMYYPKGCTVRKKITPSIINPIPDDLIKLKRARGEIKNIN